MKIIQSVVFVALCLSFGSCDIPGTLVAISRLAARADTPSCLNSVTPVCKDCKILLMLNGTCTGAGYYPDPRNCSRYHLCGAAGAIGAAYSMYECPVGFVYNPATTMCKQSKTAADCAVADCSTDPMGYVTYPADNNLFFYCSPDEEPKVLRCPVNNVFVPASFSCMFQCPHDGRIADPSDKTKFYECYFNGTTYISQSLRCVDTYEFNVEAQQCVKSPSKPPVAGSDTPPA